MKISRAGITLIKVSEGCVLNAYPDPGTGGVPYTIGYGTTIKPDGKAVKLGESIDKATAEAYLINDLQHFEKGVNDLVAPIKLTQGQFDALVSFAYNLGLGNLASSTLLKKIKVKDFVGAAAQFPKWNKAAGKVLQGLVVRRATEKTLFESIV